MLEQKKPVAPTSTNMMLALKYATSFIFIRSMKPATVSLS